MYLSLSEKLILIRKKLGLSATGMSKRIGCSAKYYTNLEKGLTGLNRDTENGLIKNLNVDKDFLYGDIKPSTEYKIFNCDISGDVGKRLKEIRIERKLTQVELSELSNISQDAISCFENGSRVMSAKYASRLGLALDVSPRWLLYGIKEEKYYPVDQDMINFLNKNEEVRKQIRKLMKKGN